MKEKELKIKQKSDFIKTRKREIFDIKEKPVNLFNNRLKADLIKKTVTEKKEQAEKATNEASVQAEEKIENTVINTGLYVADTVIPNIIKSKKGNFQKYESNLTYTDRNSSKNFDGGEIKEILRYRQEVLDDTKTVDKINQDYIKTSEHGLSGNTANTINTAQGDTSKNKVELSKLWKNGVLKTKLIEKKIYKDRRIYKDKKIQTVEKEEKERLITKVEDYKSDDVKTEFPKSSCKNMNFRDTLIKEPSEEKICSKAPLNHETNYQKVKRIKLNNRQEIQPIHNEDSKIKIYNSMPKFNLNHSHTDIKQKDFTNRHNKTRFQPNNHTETKQHRLLLHKNHRNKVFLRRNYGTVKNQNLQRRTFQSSQIKKKILSNTKKATVKATS